MKTTSEEVQTYIAIAGFAAITARLDALLFDAKLDRSGRDTVVLKTEEMAAVATLAANCRDRLVGPEIFGRERLVELVEQTLCDQPKVVYMTGHLRAAVHSVPDVESEEQDAFSWFSGEMNRLISSGGGL